MSIKKEVTAKQAGEEFKTTVDWPESLKEAIQMDTEAKVFSLYCQQKKVQIAASIRPKVASAGSMSKKSVYDKMVKAGCDEATATSVSGYTPE